MLAFSPPHPPSLLIRIGVGKMPGREPGKVAATASRALSHAPTLCHASTRTTRPVLPHRDATQPHTSPPGPLAAPLFAVLPH